MSQESNNDMEYDPSDDEFTAWLDLKFFNYKTMDHYTMRALWIYWLRGDHEVELTDEESSDSNDEGEVTGIFRIETNVFDFKTPFCKTFKEFNYLLSIDPHVLTKDIEGFKNYKEYKDDWIYKWNKDVPWVYEKPWTNTGTSLPRFKRYEALKDSEMKKEALRNKAIMKGLINDDVESNNEDDEERCELFDDATQEFSVCTIRRFKMIKYSYGQDEEYVSVKDD
nr:VIER F-box protein 2 [Tanacetum cinerariifolium]